VDGLYNPSSSLTDAWLERGHSARYADKKTVLQKLKKGWEERLDFLFTNSIAIKTMNHQHSPQESSSTKIRAALFSMVAEGRLTASEAKLLLTKTQPSEQATAPIAVIGMAGRFGDCDDLEAYWEMINAGRHCIRPIPEGRWQEGGSGVVGGFLRDADAFDALFFKISPTEAALMDPQQRLFLETAWLALEDAALSERDLAGTACGVFVGAGAGDYGRRLEAAGVGDAPLALMGNVASILAARIAYLLDLKGPALAIDTACSSSLVAVHLASEALRRGECDTAIAGGVCVINSGKFLTAMSQAGMISRSGRCHAFDARADGFVCGEGAGALVLKRLDKAIEDGNMIHGVIIGNGINQDGRTNGITAPSAPSQEALERGVQQRFGIDPGDIGYIEAHGTGTPLGDPIEVEALSRAFASAGKPAVKIPLGSVKANIGHALTAAGIAGLLKVLLMLRTGRIPPSADFQSPNPQLHLSETPFRIAGHGETWVPGANGRRLAAISSFGFSGTNAHIVVAAAPPLPARSTEQTPVYLLLSARDPDSLAQRAGLLAAHWRRHPELRLDDVAWTLAIGKTPLAYRSAFLAGSREQALAGLDSLENGGQPDSGDLPLPVRDWLAGGRPDLRPLFPAGLRRVALPGQILQRQPCLPPQPAVSGDAFSVPPAKPLPLNKEPGINATAAQADVLTQIREAGAEFCAHPDPALFSDGEAFAEVETWGRKAASAALLAAGLLPEARPVLTRAALHRNFQVIPQRAGLFDAVLAILERADLLSIEGDLLRFAKIPPVNGSGLDMECAALRRRHPATAPFLDLLAQTTAALPDVLRGRREGNSVLFPEGRLDLVGAIYKGNRLADYFNRLMALTVAAAARHQLSKDASPVHILEIGAGTGGASSAILQALAPLDQHIRYTYTDISLGFLKHGRDAFGDRIETALLDITRPPEPQGFATGGFHLVIAANVLHAVPDLKESLGYLYRLLAPEGLLVLNEVTAVQDFATLTFGLTDGWWAFRDPHRRLPGAPLADPARWQAIFADRGFPAMLNLGLPDNQRDAQAILVAKRDAAVALALPTGQRTGLPAGLSAVQAAIQTSVQSTPAPVSHVPSASLERAIQEATAQTLGMNPSAVDLSGRFMDYGVDSILGLDLINRLNRRYGLELNPTVVFAYPTVRDLARHLAENHGVSPEQETPPASPPPEPARLQADKPGVFKPGDEPIAVIGMAGRFADTDNLEEFRALLAEGRSGIVPARQRLGIDPDNPPDHLRSAAAFLRWGGLLKNIDLFDPMFFRISGREAELTDPQHRVFLTEVWRALEDAGYAGASMEGSDCGIFVGCHGGDYTHLMAEKSIVPDAFAFTGNAASILAARIAYLLDLKGPALAVDTACSSSLVAVHLACQALRAGECDMAIAGGVFINTTVGFNTAAASAGMLSPRGRCAAFDADADGFVPGEGSGAIVLKRLSQAEADGDSIIAVIAGSATNQDGKTNGITAPNAASQTALIRKAQQRARVSPSEIGYIETHGTGTRLGDPIEIEGLNGGFAGVSPASGSCLLGSVKSNVGHAAHAAGIAGLIKTLLSFRHDELYPSLHFKTANPALHLERTPFAVNTEYRSWPRPPAGRRVVGVSSFGFSGTNCHIILSDPPLYSQQLSRQLSRPHANTGAAALIVLSARSEAALQRRCRDLRQWLVHHNDVNLLDVAFTLGVGRQHFDYRWAAIAADAAGLLAALDANGPQGPMPATDARQEMLAQAAQLYRQGGLPDFAALAVGGRRIPLPTYPFEELSYWITPPQALPAAVAAPAEQGTETAGLSALMTPIWEPCPAASAPLPRAIALTGDMARCAAMAEALRTLGIATVTLAAPGVAPLAAEHLILLAPRSDDAQTLLAPLFAWLRAALAQPQQNLTLLYVHDGSALAAAAIAAAPSLRFITGHVRLRALAMAKNLADTDAARHILAELAENDQEAAIDPHGQRLVRRLQPLPWQPASPLNGGVWLITGGLGGLGPRLARHFGITRGARIALLGRSALQGDKAEQMAKLRRLGVQAHYCQADVTDAEALGRAVREFETVLGPIDGVIHAAGAPSVRSLSESTWQDMQATFAGKLDGARTLDQVLGGQPLRAFVLFSSLAAEWGDFGQCDYAVANAFLGRFAAWRNQEVEADRRQGSTVALAWPIWEGGHAALGDEGSSLVSKALGIAPLAYADGLAVLDWVLSLAHPPAEIAVMSPTANFPFANIPTAETEGSTMDTAISDTPTEAIKTGLTPPAQAAQETLGAELAELIGRLLKLDPKALKPSANFGDFGFDSIALKEFAALLTQRYGIDISPAVFFAHSSIHSLAGYMLATYPALSAEPVKPASDKTIAAIQSGFNPAPAAPRPTSPDGAVAIIGMSGRFPGADDADAFWQTLLSGHVAVGPMPAERRQLLGLTDEAANGIQAGFINAVDTFDPAFFRLSRREAIHMDPQHRLALTATWNALEDAGIVPASLAGKAVGIFLGQQVSGYAALLRDAAPEAMAQAALGNVNALMPNRISYIMDWRGPSESVDTACSSALVAVHRAVRALRGGECSMAVAGASSLLLDMKDLQTTQSLGVLSPDGRCHSFDARANGYVKGEGIGIVVLKPLQQALADGDPIHAVIRGSAVNHGGRAQSLTAPNPEAQSDLIRAALADAGVPAASIGYLETHGTGTELGDPVEIEALNSVFCGASIDASIDTVALGAVKANIGHLEPASGIAGLFKTVLALRHQVLPPVTDLQTVNPYINLLDSPLYLPREAGPWPVPAGGMRRAGISSFGFGGANAHIILEEAPPMPDTADAAPVLLVLSASEQGLLADYAERLADYLERHASVPLTDVAHTLMCGRTTLPSRAAMLIDDRNAAIGNLRALAQAIRSGAARPTDVQLGEVGDANPLALLGAEAEDQAFFRQLANAGRFGRLAEFWAAGATIDWPLILASLPEQQRGRRVHLPPAPLRQVRCWLEPSEPKQGIVISAPQARPQAQTALLQPSAPSTSIAAPLAPPATVPPPRQPEPAPMTTAKQPDRTTLTRELRGIIATALYISADELDDHARFMDLGLDSILAVEVTRIINSRFDLQLQATRLYDFPSVNDLAAHIQTALGSDAGTHAPAVTPMQKQPEIAAVAPPAGPAVPAQAIVPIAEIRTILANALYIDPQELDDHAGFADLGLDSILAVEVTNRLNSAFGTTLQATRLYDYPNLTALAGYLASQTATPVQTGVNAAASPALTFLLEQVAATAAAGASFDADTPLTSLDIGPEQAAQILTAIEKHFGVRLETAEIGACRNLAAVANLIAQRQGGQPPQARPAVPLILADSHNTADKNAADKQPHDTTGTGVLEQMRDTLAALLWLPADHVETGTPLIDLGLDRVAAQEFAERLHSLFGASAPDARAVLAAPSLAALAATLSGQVERRDIDIHAPVTDPSPQPLQPGTEHARPVMSGAYNAGGASIAEVAVTGIACRYPGAADKTAFWELLINGLSGISRVPPSRWNPDEHLAGLAKPEQREAVQWGGFIDGIDRFDPLFFNLSPREAELMDPQQRLFLEEAWHAFEDAGLSDRRLKGARCGIFIGVGQGDYSRHLPMDDPSQVTGQLLLGNTASILVSRIAYLLDLAGPAVAVDTACSSALVAADMGFRAIRDGSCDFALVGGVNLMTTPQMHVMTAASGMLSPDGQCRTFDDDAAGFVPGEGIGLLVLRRLDHAQADGDRIYGLLHGAGTNQDGKTSGITAPSSTSQERLEKDVWARFGVDPAQFGYIEAHGTGTRLGDPIEIDALTRAFAAHTDRRRDCPIGSVKTNIGHTLAASGAAGLIKTLLALHHGIIPPSLHFAKPNRHIDFARTPFYVPTSAQPWRQRRLAAVSSFGFSGTNAHLIVAAAPPPLTAKTPAAGEQLIVLSGRDSAGLRRQAESLLNFLIAADKAPALADIAHTMNYRRSHWEFRLAIIAQDVPELIGALTAFCSGRADNRLMGPEKRRREPEAFDPGLIGQGGSSGQTRRLAKIAALWLQGTDIPWASVQTDGHFVDLPVTVFAGLRCWLDTQAANSALPILETAPVTAPATASGLDRALLHLTADMPVMANHRIRGQAILPGMASLALFYAEARRLGFYGSLSAVNWRIPVAAPACLTLQSETNNPVLTLRLVDAEGRTVAQATARQPAKPQPLPVDLSVIRADCRTEVQAETIYRRLEAGGIQHGAGFRLLDKVHTGGGQILALLRPSAPETYAPIDGAGLSPALLDSALQALGALNTEQHDGASLLPSGIRQFTVHGIKPGPVYAWLTLDRNDSGEHKLVADLRLLDAQGEVLVEMLGFEARPPQPSPPPAQLDAPEPLDTPATAGAGELLLLRPHWLPSAPPSVPSAQAPLVLHSYPEAAWAARLAAEHGGDAIMLDTLSTPALANLIAHLANGRPIVFAAWRENAGAPLDDTALQAAEQRGVHALHRLLKEVGKHSTVRKLLIVTRGIQQIQAEDTTDPAFAALPGFARSAARELSRLLVTCIDLDTTPATPEIAKRERAWLLREPVDTVLAYRSGMRFLQGLARLLPDTGELRPVLPQGAVCLLLGGAGGLGLATSLHLARRYAARIAWLGRRPPDHGIERSLAAVAESGGQAIYLQADIADPAALHQAVTAVRQQWGHITLAWHGAIVLRDKSVAALTADDLAAVLAPKTRGLRNLIEALDDDPPEFLALCSSANAFTVNPGQANYAAASTFADALALAQNQRPGWRVRILNWGIWGETGIVAEERYLQRARQAGVEPLTTSEGLAIFERSLQWPQAQLIALKVAADNLPEMSAALTETLRFGEMPALLDVANGCRELSAAFAGIAPDSLHDQAEAMAASIRYGRERLFRLYAGLGLERQCPARLAPLADALGIIAERRGLLLAHLDILARCGWVSIGYDDNADGPIIACTGQLPSTPVNTPSLQSGAMRLLVAALDGTADVLTGRRPATDILFPGGRNDLVEAVYRDDPAADLFNRALGAAVAALSTGKPLRVIEIGAGTGSTTGPVLTALDRHAPDSHYVYTDVSAHFVAAGEARFGARPATEFRNLDIGRHPHLQDMKYGDFDIVIAANVLHALPNLLDVLGHVKALLKPDGIALLLEATARSDFATFTFGLTDGWWAFADAPLRIPHSPLLSLPGWRIAAASRGLHLAGTGQIPGSDAQSILILRSDGWLPVAATVAAESGKAKPALPEQAPKPLADASFLANVQNVVAGVLRLDSSLLDPDEPLERYGVDSLVVNDINARLQTQLGAFPNNLVFEAVTLRALAERLQPLVNPLAESAAEPEPAIAGVEPETAAPSEDAIAVIGIAGRFPDADNIELFWDNLEQGHCAIGPLPAGRQELWPSGPHYDGGYLRDVAGFDALFFNIAPNEAALMDPQERLFLETAWASLENAGRLTTAWEGKVGVFVGVMCQDYLRLAAENGGQGDTAAWSIANRLSHILNLTGPSLAVNTACSSALTALHLACESLRQGECDTALTGSVHLLLHPASRQGLQALGMLSAGGVAKPFSRDADGMVGGEGVCCLVLRRLDDALTAGDRILGVIRATGLAANGRTRNYMAPNAESQAAALRAFSAQRQIGDIAYVECQAVGSPMGDAIEVAGLARGLPDTGQAVLIGSTEGAIGHLEAASGSAQIAKILGMFSRRRWLPSIGTGELSPDVLAAMGNRFQVARTTQPWPETSVSRRALVQSFGAGGGSAFAVIGEAPADKPLQTDAANQHGIMAIPLSARTVGSLRRMAQELAGAVRGRLAGVTLPAVAWTLQTGRTAFDHRLVLLVDNLDALGSALTAFLAGRPGAWQQGERKGAGKSNGKGPADNDPATVAAYWVEGHNVDWQVLWPSPHRPLPVALPGYAFEHRRCWIQPPDPDVRPAKVMIKPPAAKPQDRPPRPASSIPVPPSERKLLSIQGPGEAEDLLITAEALSLPPAGEVLIEVLACGLNFADLLCVRGLHPNLKTYPYLPGFEVSGIVAAVGDGVTNLQAGDKVIALSGGRGGLASHVTVPEPWVALIPDDVDQNLAAATPIGYLTMAHALDRADLRAGETILIQSAAGGTGPLAVQLALARGAKVIATAGSAEKLAALRRLGAHDTINYREEDFFSRAKAITNGRGVDVVLNTLGGDAIQKGIALLAAGGRYCEIALAGLRASKALDLSGLTENQSIITINLGRLLADPEASRAAMQDMAEALAAKRIKPLVSAVFTMDQFAAAFRHIDTRQNIGKVILKPDPHIAVSELHAGPAAMPSGDSLPLLLRGMAAEILGLAADEIDSGRPLADYGLNSVGAVALMRGVHQRYGLAVPVAAVYEAQTINGLAAHLATAVPPAPKTALGRFFQQPAASNYTPLVPIRSGSGQPSFWIHGAPGDASWVLGLAEVIGGDAPVYGLEARGVNGKDEPHRSVETMARDYVAALRDVQPQGPYRLGGYSGGGVIAYEMARQLIAEGESIDKLVLLDGYAPGNQALKRMGEVYQDGFIYQLSVNWLGRRWSMSELLSADALRDVPADAQLQTALEHLYRHARPDVGRERLAVYLAGMKHVGDILGKALENYVAQPLAHNRFDTLLLRCTAGMSAKDNHYALPHFLVEADYTAGWPDLLGGRLRIENLDCDHFTLMDQPWLGQAGAAISAFFAAPAATTTVESINNTGLDQHVRSIIIAEASRVLMKDLPDILPPNISLNELGAHSVDRAEIAAAAMERLDVAVPLSILAKASNIDDLVELLAGQLSSNTSKAILAYKTEH